MGFGLLACQSGANAALDDAGIDVDAALGIPDGPAVREPCTKTFGTALNTTFGRLDGILTAVLPPGRQACPSDADHVHLQVRSLGAVYDIAITAVDLMGVDVDYLAKDAPLPGAPWSEGWHTGLSLDFVQLGLHAADFAATPKAALAQAVQQELLAANHVSIFATPYPDGTGAHRVHRNGGGADGALVIKPTAATARLLAFHFVTQSF